MRRRGVMGLRFRLKFLTNNEPETTCDVCVYIFTQYNFRNLFNSNCSSYANTITFHTLS